MGWTIDWEYPVIGGKRTDHKRNTGKASFVLLLKQLRSDLDAVGHERHLLLTGLDWFNLMGYDFNEMQLKRASPHSGLFAWAATSKLDADAMKYANSDAAVQWYLDHGVPTGKIVLGLLFMGKFGPASSGKRRAVRILQR
jgi:chitinase